MASSWSVPAGLAVSLSFLPLAANSVWTVQVEEPTGIYRRVNEVIHVPIRGSSFTVVDAAGKELPWQATNDGVLFPASVIPGELPVYRISGQPSSPRFPNEIIVRKIGLRRVELGNSHFRIVIDTGIPAIVEAYNLSAEEHHRLNLVETTPESADSLKNDIHTASDIPPRVPGVDGENLGWTSFGSGGGLDKVELLETGPLRGRVRLSRGQEIWELEWTAGSPALHWKAPEGFRFLSVSAAPFLPFDHCVSGDEYAWPQGPEHVEPPDNGIGPRPWKKLPGDSAVYYNGQENYGALGIISLDDKLEWTGVGSRRFIARKASGDAEIALIFTGWDGYRTALNARQDSGIVRHPLLVKVAEPVEGTLTPTATLAREERYEAVRGSAKPTPFHAESLSLDGDWQLAYADKGATSLSDARTVKVPGSVHTQWYPGDPFSSPPPKYFTHEADWISRKEWWYKKTFHAPDDFAGKTLRLQFDATDYYADAYVNGQYLGRHEGYMDPYEYEVTDKIKPGADNEIKVRIWTPVTYYWRHRPYTVKGSYGAVDQKPDDITAEGITRDIRLVASGAAIVNDAAVDTRLLDDAGAKAEVEVNLETSGNVEGCTWELTVSPEAFRHLKPFR